MYKKILPIFLLVAISTIITVFLTPKIKEKSIKKEIEKANYCQIEADCINVGDKCPFGCYNYVNKNEFDRISELINSFDSKCVYGCLSCEKVICEKNKCQEICE